METGDIQQAINDKALSRVFKDYDALIEALKGNPISAALKFKKGDEWVPLCGHYSVLPLFDRYAPNKNGDAENYINLAEVRNALYVKYRQEEVAKLLNTVQAFAEFVNVQSHLAYEEYGGDQS